MISNVKIFFCKGDEYNSCSESIIAPSEGSIFGEWLAWLAGEGGGHELYNIQQSLGLINKKLFIYGNTG